MMGQQPGLSKAPHSEIGKIMDLYCGYAAIVCFSCACLLLTVDFFPDLSAGVGKSVLWYATGRLFL